jgi:exodeoxyribonuclease V alpha subunit
MSCHIYHQLWSPETSSSFAGKWVERLLLLKLPAHHAYAALWALSYGSLRHEEDRAVALHLIAAVFAMTAKGSFYLPRSAVKDVFTEWQALLNEQCRLLEEQVPPSDAGFIRQYRDELIDIETRLINNLDFWLNESPLVIAAGIEPAPLVIYKDTLYIRKYWLLEEDMLQTASTALVSRLLPPEYNSIVNTIPDKVERAAAIIMRSGVLLLTGGPGYGKTTALAVILQKLLTDIRQEKFTIYLTAPTGRAAARMAESLRAFSFLQPYINGSLTLHRLLKYNPQTGKTFYNKDNPLDADLVALDEASMLDAVMFGHLLKALPDRCRLILIGDVDQLPSVGIGAVFEDLVGNIQADKSHRLAGNCIVLDKCYRSDKVILEAAQTILKKDKESIDKILSAAPVSRIETFNLEDITYKYFLKTLAERYQKLFSEKADKDQLFEALSRFIIITPLADSGIYSSQFLNKALSALIAPAAEFYHGQPVIMNANEPQFALNNGERGVMIKEDNEYALYFGGERIFPAALVKNWDTAYAITIHKSQGSEFEEAAVLVTPGSQRVLSRKLLYTALTRAKNKVFFYKTKNEFELALRQKDTRYSRLKTLFSL